MSYSSLASPRGIRRREGSKLHVDDDDDDMEATALLGFDDG